MFNLKGLQRSKTLKYGLPMLLLVVGGSFGLREFTKIRCDVQRKQKKLDPSLQATVNLQDQELLLEKEYEKLKTDDLDSWKNIRGPRPWEDSRQYQNQQRSKQKNQ